MLGSSLSLSSSLGMFNANVMLLSFATKFAAFVAARVR